jgi:sortase A
MSEILFTASRPPGSSGQGSRRRPARRPNRGLRALSGLLILVGVLALLDAGVTLVWQEPISAIYARLQQNRLNGALQRVDRAQPTATELQRLAVMPHPHARVAFLARELERHSSDGSAVGRIRIPSIGASFVVVKGTGTSDLQKGPGIYSQTSFPGVPGTTAIAGHRTTYLAPFRHIDALRNGSRIVLEMPYAHFVYTVIGQRVVQPTDVAAAVDRVGYSRLVLSACTPLYSAAQRILVYARLTQTIPTGAASRA